MVAGPSTSITFLNLREGAEFEWVIPPMVKGFEVKGEFVKSGPRTFGPHGCPKMFDVAERELEYLVRVL